MNRDNLLLTLFIHSNTETQYYRKHDLFVEKQKKFIENIRHEVFDALPKDRQEYYIDSWFWSPWRFNDIAGYAEIELKTEWTIIGHLYLPEGRATRVAKKPLFLNYACTSCNFEEHDLGSLRKAIITLAEPLQSHIADRKWHLEFYPEMVNFIDFFEMLKERRKEKPG